ncbi:hypothetical protein GPJ56_008146 [Histomonas meleagridis]|nr:hypothetical protein GPJ56_008146 [Histomonas meleagridis]
MKRNHKSRKTFKKNNDKHSKLQVQLRDIRSKSGIKNQEEALAKIDQIDHRIEVETLTSPQLRKLISERDRIFTVMKELVSADKLIKEDDDCRKRVNQLYEEKKKVQTQISELLQKRNSTRTQLDSLREETKKYNNQVQVYYNKIKELREELNGINGERGKEQNEYRKLLKEYRNKLNQITDIHYERDVIYREAERTMLQILEGQKNLLEKLKNVKIHIKKRLQHANHLSQIRKECKDNRSIKRTNNNKMYNTRNVLIKKPRNL